MHVAILSGAVNTLVSLAQGSMDRQRAEAKHFVID